MFALIFAHINNNYKPHIISKLNIWEWRRTTSQNNVQAILELLIATSTTFKTKTIKTAGGAKQNIITTTLLMYATTVVIYWSIF